MILTMTIQFICRGNVFRSIIAETYLRSLQIPGVQVYSSGTVAGQDKAGNWADYQKVHAFLISQHLAQFIKPDYGEDINQALLDKSDVVVFMNERAYKEAAGKFHFPKDTQVWDVSDLNELPEVPETDQEIMQAVEKVFHEITTRVDALVRRHHLQA